MADTGLKSFLIYDVRLSEVEPGIVCVDYGTRIVTADLVTEIQKKVAREWRGRKVALLVKGPAITDIPAVAMALDRSPAKEMILASALVSTSNLEETIADTLLDSREAPYPTRRFDTEDEAFRWLRDYAAG